MLTHRGAELAHGEPVRSYSTRFDTDEELLSEGGIWLNGRKDGIDWTDVTVRGSTAFGARSRTDMGDSVVNPVPDSDAAWIYDDPTAVLTGSWGPDQYAAAIVFSRNPTERYYQEVEFRLRSSISPHRCTGYEVFWRCLKSEHGYVEIVRWNGRLGDFTSLCKYSGAEYGVTQGDEIEATIVGNVITGYLNGRKVISTVDDTFAGGSPGVGFNFGVGPTNLDFGLSWFETRTFAPAR